MADEFSDEIVEQAWARSGGHCECERTTHGHVGKHNKLVLKSFRGNRNSDYGWEAHSISGSHIDTVSDCKIFCWNPCHKSTL